MERENKWAASSQAIVQTSAGEGRDGWEGREGERSRLGY